MATTSADQKYFETRYHYDKSRKAVWKAICEYLQKDIPTTSVLLELGSGYCDFINQIIAHKKYALDSNTEVSRNCSQDVTFINSSAVRIGLEDQSVDVVFASNLLEHLNDDEMQRLFTQLDRILKRGGKLILMQPNYYYCFREYWDDFSHKKAFSHTSLCDYLMSRDYIVTSVKKRFLPFSFKSFFPKSYILTKIYLLSPWKPAAKQMLIVAKKRG